ncbi:YqzG/YhdC family protein [Paenibacillus sp. HWE-109]|uniref:DUF3889 domain-containing protein n=1 Tax=Paenibacillus sp. HWE-109 TaxID=1306526 RepID=UPI001EDF4ACD|nr:DUF3889 domain-containing protein [Paenibacillus sp. HWE-109]UKS27777.1 YqzG/YhdC family protein [Paenibacillus sp. HWE-109]
MFKFSTALLLMGFAWSDDVQACIGESERFLGAEIIAYQEPDPEYAKWSRLAFHEAGKVYTLLDYKYLGRSIVASGVAQQQFRFWVRHHGVEFPLIVSIRYDPISEKVFTIEMAQEKRGNLQIL